VVLNWDNDSAPGENAGVRNLMWAKAEKSESRVEKLAPDSFRQTKNRAAGSICS